MEYRKFSREQRRELLENTLANLESQHFARALDIEKWERILQDPLADAVAADTRILNNRDQEAKGQLAGAHYDVRKLEISIEQIRREIDSLGNA